MKITLTQLRRAMPKATKANLEKYHPYLVSAMEEFGIDTPLRIAHFLAQVAWESGSLRYAEEIASGAAYEGRKDLGNTESGDGIRFKGRGLLQLTGRSNYAAYSKYCGTDLTVGGNWKLLAQPRGATRSAAWFWQTHGLNELADGDEFTKITRRINGSSATVQKRLPFLRSAKVAVGLIKG